MIVSETGKYYDESARTARAVLLGQGMQQAVAGAMSNATAAAAVMGTGLSASGAAMAQQAASKAAYMDQAHQVTKQLPKVNSMGDASQQAFAENRRNESEPGLRESPSSRRNFGGGGDDPFAE